ncbi:trypsin-like serine protease [Streptomyces sp. NPDC001312]|uniref:trypsin-like serine protease n=1 Tax=Streptomyces sp. NPDC001312 TaxID=3364561 RepID=UPI0036C2E626
MATSTCASRWRDPLTAGQIRTYTPGRDTCRYDSGGPLVHRYGTRPYLVAVDPHGEGCAGSTPTVNTRVIPYIKDQAGRPFLRAGVRAPLPEFTAWT